MFGKNLGWVYRLPIKSSVKLGRAGRFRLQEFPGSGIHLPSGGPEFPNRRRQIFGDMMIPGGLKK
jgi:hypothetical protein